jgi:hypothetical protein
MMAAAVEHAKPRPAPGSRVGLAGAAIAIATDLLYLSIIVSQDPVDWARVSFYAGAILLAGSASVVASVARVGFAIRLVLYASAVGALLSLGILGLLSIGLPLLVAGVLVILAWRRAWGIAPAGSRGPLPSLLAFVAGALVPLVGLAIR